MSLTSQKAERATLDMKMIERGLENGRALRSQAFMSFLKGLFAGPAKESRQEARRIADCAAAA
jgi:hypothetical protein